MCEHTHVLESNHGVLVLREQLGAGKGVVKATHEVPGGYIQCRDDEGKHHDPGQAFFATYTYHSDLLVVKERELVYFGSLFPLFFNVAFFLFVRSFCSFSLVFFVRSHTSGQTSAGEARSEESERAQDAEDKAKEHL